MTEDERLDLLDQLPADMNIWADDDELDTFTGRDLRWWLDALEHPKAHRGCCKKCGCASPCMAAAFYEATTATILRELDKIGALRKSERDRTAEQAEAERLDTEAW